MVFIYLEFKFALFRKSEPGLAQHVNELILPRIRHGRQRSVLKIYVELNIVEVEAVISGSTLMALNLCEDTVGRHLV